MRFLIFITLLCVTGCGRDPFDLPSELKQNSPLVMILFTLDDCPLCLFEGEYWSVASESNLFASFVGVTRQGQADLSSYLLEYHIDFPVLENDQILMDLEKEIQANGYIYKTPMKIFLSGTGDILGVEYGQKDMEQQALFPARIDEIFK